MARRKDEPLISRRTLLQTTLMSGLYTTTKAFCGEDHSEQQTDGEPLTYATHAKGIRIIPGQWRPHYPQCH